MWGTTCTSHLRKKRESTSEEAILAAMTKTPQSFCYINNDCTNKIVIVNSIYLQYLGWPFLPFHITVLISVALTLAKQMFWAVQPQPGQQPSARQLCFFTHVQSNIFLQLLGSTTSMCEKRFLRPILDCAVQFALTTQNVPWKHNSSNSWKKTFCDLLCPLSSLQSIFILVAEQERFSIARAKLSTW